MDSRTNRILEILKEKFPNPKSELEYDSVFQLLVAVVLSAQCTDKRVNSVTPQLFKVAPTPQAMSALPIPRLEELIHSCGFYRNKAKNLHECAQMLVEKYGGEVPEDFDELTKLPGVGNKTASVVWAVGFHRPAFAVDTHIFRVAHRLSLSEGKTPDKVSADLKGIFPSELWGDCHHYLLLHGRYTCKAVTPLCNECEFKDFCKFEPKKNKRKSTKEKEK